MAHLLRVLAAVSALAGVLLAEPDPGMALLDALAIGAALGLAARRDRVPAPATQPSR
jgi:hypothetical protein